MLGTGREGRSAPALTGMKTAKGTFFRFPVKERWWIGVLDAERECFALTIVSSDAAGVYLQDTSRDRYFYLAADGLVSMRFGVDPWSAFDRGVWYRGQSWAVDVEKDGAKRRHRLAWTGDRFSFVNDPRYVATGVSTMPSASWYQVEADGACHPFTATAAHYGAVTVQRLTLTPPLPELPGWTVANGEAGIGALRFAGDWMH